MVGDSFKPKEGVSLSVELALAALSDWINDGRRMGQASPSDSDRPL